MMSEYLYALDAVFVVFSGNTNIVSFETRSFTRWILNIWGAGKKEIKKILVPNFSSVKRVITFLVAAFCSARVSLHGSFHCFRHRSDCCIPSQFLDDFFSILKLFGICCYCLMTFWLVILVRNKYVNGKLKCSFGER
jgi:hypothetical protein